MAILNISPTLKPWSWQKKSLPGTDHVYAKGSVREQLISLTQVQEGHAPGVDARTTFSDFEKFNHNAMVRDPISGECLGRVRLSDLAFDKPMMNFQLVKGCLKKAWAKESVLLICPLNGPARYIKIMAHPPEDCDIGIFRVEQTR